MTVTIQPKMLSRHFTPGLEAEHEVGLSGVGVHVVEATLAVNTIATAANLIASPPNTAGLATCGPVVHSLGCPPTAVIPMQVGPHATSFQEAITYQYCTADNSAVYLFARCWTTVNGANLAGVGTRLVVIR